LNNFQFTTLGGRWLGSEDSWLWELEGGVQFGDNTNGSDHQAGFATGGLGYKWADRCWQPQLWAYYDWAAGGDVLGAGTGFNHLFPLAHKYLGYMDLFGITSSHRTCSSRCSRAASEAAVGTTTSSSIRGDLPRHRGARQSTAKPASRDWTGSPAGDVSLNARMDLVLGARPTSGDLPTRQAFPAATPTARAVSLELRSHAAADRLRDQVRRRSPAVASAVARLHYQLFHQSGRGWTAGGRRVNGRAGVGFRMLLVAAAEFPPQVKRGTM
jgi:hypothetical protein